jgi:hypothetical protein
VVGTDSGFEHGEALGEGGAGGIGIAGGHGEGAQVVEVRRGGNPTAAEQAAGGIGGGFEAAAGLIYIAKAQVGEGLLGDEGEAQLGFPGAAI